MGVVPRGLNRSEPSSVGGKTLAGLPLSAGARPVRRLRTRVAVTGVPKSSPETGIRAGWESARRVVRRAFKKGGRWQQHMVHTEMAWPSGAARSYLLMGTGMVRRVRCQMGCVIWSHLGEGPGYCALQ